jgi:hypothetical protein
MTVYGKDATILTNLLVTAISFVTVIPLLTSIHAFLDPYKSNYCLLSINLKIIYPYIFIFIKKGKGQ